ncbi:MAG TPA: TonB-dependent receptor [Pseudohongiella sp.]|nr:TonB-dependent receptor [Pseudohongiella sp.]HEA63756.1 TonB-dependent receptor [Pseudohongiella sp.]
MLSGAYTVGLGAFSAAQAQDAGAEIEEVVVTGSRITSPNLTLSSPVASVDAETIELRQVNVVEEFLREIPGVVPSIGASVNNGNGGSTFIDLRGLGSNRNITLLNGTRVVPADLQGRTNLDIIPVALLERVDVLTGGAGTAYGADAISGVINFRTRTDFEGLDIRVSQSDTFEGGGESNRFDVTLGGNFDDNRGNAVISMGYTDRTALTQGERDYSVENISSISGNAGGSSTSIPTRFTLPGAAPADIRAVVPGYTSGFLQSSPDGSRLEPYYQDFNFNPFNLFQLPLEQHRAYGSANYQLTDDVEWYSEALFVQSTNITNLAPSGSFGFSAMTPLSNPFIPDATRGQLCGAFQIDAAACTAAAGATDPSDPAYQEVNVNYARRFLELGPRTNERKTTAWQFKTGARGDLTDTLSWDLFYATGQSDLRQQQGGNGTRSRLTQAVRATNPNTCLDTSGGCVPIDLWGPLGSITSEVGEFLDVGNGGSEFTELDQFQAFVSGDLPWSLPTVDAPISGVVGYEQRDYTAGLTNDLLTQTPGEVLGNGAAAPNTFGTYDVSEFFFEANVPVLQNMALVEELTLQLGFRSSDYSTTGVEDTWKIGGTWSPTEDLQFRGNFQRVTRAPNISELFDPAVTGLDNFSSDPCAGAAPEGNAQLLAVCLAQGAPTNTIGGIVVDPAGQVNVTTGGNPNLEAEDAETWTIGAIWQPSMVPGLSLTLDYYSILVEDAITDPTPDDVFSACFGPNFATGSIALSGASASDPACTGIRRNPETGNLFGNVATTAGLPLVLSNQGTLETSGIDATASYTFDLGGIGSLSYNGSLNWTEQSLFQASPNGLNRECTGFYSGNCASPQPDFMANQRATLQTNVLDRDVDVSLLWRYLSEMEVEPGSGTYQPQFRSMDAANYFDLTVRGSVTEEFEFTLGILNLADREPDVVGSNIGATAYNTGNVYPSTYDPLGRRYSLTLRYSM